MCAAPEAPSRPIETFVFMDLEATGLPPSQPKIAEMCLFAVTRNALENPQYNRDILKQIPLFPRLVDKLCICIDPDKPFTPIASSVTGLTNEAFAKNKRQPFNIHVLHMISAFLCRQQTPICLVAHNGWNYDFPLLKAELSSLGFSGLEEIYCADTIKAMRALDAKGNHGHRFAYQPDPLGSRKNYSLRDVYFKFFKVYPLRSHNAEDDVIALITVFQQRARDLMGWMDSNARPLKTVRVMFKEEKTSNSFSKTPEDIQPLHPKPFQVQPQRKVIRKSSLGKDNDVGPKYPQNILLLFLAVIVMWVALQNPV